MTIFDKNLYSGPGENDLILRFLLTVTSVARPTIIPLPTTRQHVYSCSQNT